MSDLSDFIASNEADEETEEDDDPLLIDVLSKVISSVSNMGSEGKGIARIYHEAEAKVIPGPAQEQYEYMVSQAVKDTPGNVFSVTAANLTKAIVDDRHNALSWYNRNLKGSYAGPQAYLVFHHVLTATEQGVIDNVTEQALSEADPMVRMLHIVVTYANTLVKNKENTQKTGPWIRMLLSQWVMDLLYSDRIKAVVDENVFLILQQTARLQYELAGPDDRYSEDDDPLYEIVTGAMTALETETYVNLMKTLLVCSNEKVARLIKNQLLSKVLHTSPNRLDQATSRLTRTAAKNWEEFSRSTMHTAAILFLIHLTDSSVYALSGSPFPFMAFHKYGFSPNIDDPDPLKQLNCRMYKTSAIAFSIPCTSIFDPWDVLQTDSDFQIAMEPVRNAGDCLAFANDKERFLYQQWLIMLEQAIIIQKRIRSSSHLRQLLMSESSDEDLPQDIQLENKQLRDEISHMRIQHDLKLKNAEAEVENRIEKEKRIWQEQIDALQKENLQLSKEADALKNENKKLKTDSETLEMYRDIVLSQESEKEEIFIQEQLEEETAGNPWEAIDSFFEDYTVAFVGGHERLIRDLHLRYPKAKIFHSLTDDDRLLEHADQIFIFYNFISHPLYYRAMQVAKSKHIPADYISAKNLELALSEMQAVVRENLRRKQN